MKEVIVKIATSPHFQKESQVPDHQAWMPETETPQPDVMPSSVTWIYNHLQNARDKASPFAKKDRL
jgi:hypothetical protein